MRSKQTCSKQRHSKQKQQKVRIGLTAIDRLCIPVPLYHCFGMVMGNLACAVHGATMVYPAEAFDPQAVLETVEADSDMRLICGDCAGRGAGRRVPPAVREIFFRVQRITPAEFTRGVAADADAISDLSGRLRRLITAAIGHDKPFEREGRMRTEAGK